MTKMRTGIALAFIVLLAVSLAWSQQPDQKPAQPAQSAPAAQPAPLQADQAPQPSLADIARANKAKKAKKVYDEDDLPKTGGLAGGSAAGLNPTPAADNASTKDAKTAPDQPAANSDAAEADSAKDDKAPKSPADDRMAYLQKDLQDMQTQRDLIQGKLDKETSDSQKAVWAELLLHLQEQYQKEQQELDQLKSKPTAPKS